MHVLLCILHEALNLLKKLNDSQVNLNSHFCYGTNDFQLVLYKCYYKYVFIGD